MKTMRKIAISFLLLAAASLAQADSSPPNFCADSHIIFQTDDYPDLHRGRVECKTDNGDPVTIDYMQDGERRLEAEARFSTSKAARQRFAEIGKQMAAYCLNQKNSIFERRIQVQTLDSLAARCLTQNIDYDIQARLAGSDDDPRLIAVTVTSTVRKVSLTDELVGKVVPVDSVKWATLNPPYLICGGLFF